MIQKWEYYDHWTFAHEGGPDLNIFGKDGWELVSVIYIAHTSTTVHYFKRPIPQPSTVTKIFNEVLGEVDPRFVGITDRSEGEKDRIGFADGLDNNG